MVPPSGEFPPGFAEKIEYPVAFDLQGIPYLNSTHRRAYAEWERKERIVLRHYDLGAQIFPPTLDLTTKLLEHVAYEEIEILDPILRKDKKDKWVLSVGGQEGIESGFKEVSFIPTPDPISHHINNEIWIRDWFPFSVEETTTDASRIPQVGQGWIIPQQILWNVNHYCRRAFCPAKRYEFDMKLDGGDFVADGRNTCAVTSTYILEVTQDLSLWEIVSRFKRILGCEKLLVLEGVKFKNGENRHVDLFFKFLPENRFLLSEAILDDPSSIAFEENYALLTELIEEEFLTGTITRIPTNRYLGLDFDRGGRISGYTFYANSYLLDENTIFIPQYSPDWMGCRPVWKDGEYGLKKLTSEEREEMKGMECSGFWEERNQSARSVYERLGFEVVPVNVTRVMGRGGAVRCMINEIFSLEN